MHPKKQVFLSIVVILVFLVLISILSFVNRAKVVNPIDQGVSVMVHSGETTVDAKIPPKQLGAYSDNSIAEPLSGKSKYAMELEKTIHSGDSPYFFTLKQPDSKKDTSYTIDINRALGTKVQTILVESENGILERDLSPFYFDDFDYDGYLDLKFVRTPRHFHLYRFNPQSVKFEYVDGFPLLNDPMPHPPLSGEQVIYSLEVFGLRTVQHKHRIVEGKLLELENVEIKPFYQPEDTESQSFIKLTRQQVNNVMTIVTGSFIDKKTQAETPIPAQLLLDRYYVINLYSQKSDRYTDADTVMSLLGWKSIEAHNFAWTKKFKDFAFDRREPETSDSLDRTYYVKLLPGASDPATTTAYTAGQSNAIFTPAPTKISKMMEDPKYCEVDSDCINGGGMCSTYPSNFISKMVGFATGCERAFYPDETPEYLSTACGGTGKVPRIVYSNLSCSANKCIANEKKVVACYDEI